MADEEGNLYGMGLGDVFMLSPQGDGSWQYTVLATAPTGSDRSPLIRDTAGNLYGTDASQVFEVVPNADRTVWTMHSLYTFCLATGCADGMFPKGGLSYAGSASGAPYDGTSPLYGTTFTGGAHGDGNRGGVVYRLTPAGGGAWQEASLYDFCAEDGCADGEGPEGGVVVDGSGNLIGTTSRGGTGHQFHSDGGAGTVFKLTRSGDTWTHGVLHHFCSDRRRHLCRDGETAHAGVVIDGAGNIFGTTHEGGKLQRGGAYRLTPDGSGGYAFSTIEPFDAGSFTAMTMDAWGNLYGTTENGGAKGMGAVYRLSFDGTAWTTTELYGFCARNRCQDGSNPAFSTVLLDAHGDLFGTTFVGGRHDGGTVFELVPQ